MAHIVFVTYGIASYLNAGFALAAQLRQRGHRITYVSSLDVGDAVRMQGFDFVLLQEEHRIRQDPERLVLERMSWWRRLRHRAALIRVGRRQRHFYLQSSEWDGVMARLRPDLLLIDEELPETIMGTAYYGVPTLLVQYINATRRHPGVPPVSSGLIPDGSWWNRLAIAMQWRWLLLKRGVFRTVAPLYFADTDRHSILQALAAKTGFVGRTSARHWFPIVFPEIPTLFLEAPEYDFPHEGQVDGYYVGPMVWRERTDDVDDPEAMASLQTFMMENAAQKRPLIYCSLGTTWHSNVAYLQRVIDAFRRHPAWDLVLVIGRDTPPAAFHDVPQNVLLCSYVPQLMVLAQADLMLTHGGVGTINECITFDVPMIVYSTGNMEQHGSAARVVYHGMGLRGDIDSASAETIAARIAQMLATPTFAENVAQMQRIYARYEAEARAVTLIEAQLS